LHIVGSCAISDEMKKHRDKRNWSEYNQKLKKIARIEFFISEEAISNWEYRGKRVSGGKLLYSDLAIELCLLMKEFYKLPYRQTQGFVESVFQSMNLSLSIPDYSTISRRASKINISIRKKQLIRSNNEAIVVAVDSTGLSLYTRTEWNRLKHQKKQLLGYEKWRKLHVIVNVNTGEILNSSYGISTMNDGCELPSLLDCIEENVSAVCGDMAYDRLNCRKAIKERNARQLIPPIRKARISSKNRNIRKHKAILQERDEAIEYIQNNTINNDSSLARKSWKEKVGYHARSLVETTMWQIKRHCSDYLSNKLESTRSTQAKIKCKVINYIIAA
jgi:hypothetical protein